MLKQKTPFVFVDKILEYEKGKRIVAQKNVSGSEFFASLHFPGNPVYPGIFIIESVAQAASILCALEEGTEEDVQFMALGGIQRFDFHKPARPGDVLRIEVNLVKMYKGMAIVKACVKADGEAVAEGQMTFGTVRENN